MGGLKNGHAVTIFGGGGMTLAKVETPQVRKDYLEGVEQSLRSASQSVRHHPIRGECNEKRDSDARGLPEHMYASAGVTDASR